VQTTARRLAGLLPGFLLVAAAASAMPSLLWFKGGQPTTQAIALLAQLASAADRGLDGSDYDSDNLAASVERLRHSAAPSRSELEMSDAALTRAALSYAHDLHSGRIDARAAGVYALELTPQTGFAVAEVRELASSAWCKRHATRHRQRLTSCCTCALAMLAKPRF